MTNIHVTNIHADITKKLTPLLQDQAAIEAWWFLEALTQKTQAELIKDETVTLTNEQYHTLERWLDERVTHKKPLQYIIGHVPFCGISIAVKPPILIPRPETEEWTTWLIQTLEPVKDKPLTILDLCAGSGCIALALSKALPYANVIGVDIDPHAIQLCEQNKARNAIQNAIFIQSNLYAELGQYKNTIDLIISNPPYIAEAAYNTLDPQVTEWEDKKALVAGSNGFAIHQHIIDGADSFLKKQNPLTLYNMPRLVLEFGKGQGETLKAMLSNAHFDRLHVYKDMSDTDRWITGEL